jgi:ribosomal protein S8E
MVHRKLQMAMEEEQRLQKEIILGKKKKVRSMIAKKVAKDKKQKEEMNRVLMMKMKENPHFKKRVMKNIKKRKSIAKGMTPTNKLEQ